MTGDGVKEGSKKVDDHVGHAGPHWLGCRIGRMFAFGMWAVVPRFEVLSGSWCSSGFVLDQVWVTCVGKGRKTDRGSACNMRTSRPHGAELSETCGKAQCVEENVFCWRQKLSLFFSPSQPTQWRGHQHQNWRAPTRECTVPCTDQRHVRSASHPEG